MKPRIRKNATWGWECWARGYGGWTGYGRTPHEAWVNWAQRVAQWPVGRLESTAQQALEALRELLPDERDPNCGGYDARDVRQWRATATALRAALAEPVQEPVAWEGWWLHHGQHNYRAKPLTSERVKELMKLAFEVGQEAAPPQRKPLTQEEIPALAEKAWTPSVYHDAEALLGTDGLVALVRAVEAKHNIKE